MLKEGDTAPDFELTDNNEQHVRLSSLKERKNVVLCFYPKNHMFACPSKKVFEQAKSIVDNYERMKQLDAEVFGISVDTVESHKKFVNEYSIPYQLLSDTSKNVCKQYAGLNMYGLANRTTYIIDKNGRIARIFTKTDPKVHGEEIVAALSMISTQVT
ncbi:MAG: peroxiredoxin Q/BCP [Candidatus Nitrosomirales archaeon]|jgi:peroxiredoxin Q/BCP